MYSLKNEKDKLRREYLKKREELDCEYRKNASYAVCKRITSLISYRYCTTLLLYCPVNCELDILPLFEMAICDGKSVAFPRCDKAKGTMNFHFVTDMSELKKGAYGIREPAEDLPVYDKKSKDAICIIPALVYDKKGYRLGYGGGYYDRYLSDFKGTKIGTGFSGFTVSKLPHSRYDTKCEVLVTEKGVVSFYEN